jgi:hypothetical protein
MYKMVDVDVTNFDTMLYSDAQPKQIIFLPACVIAPTSISNAVELRGPHLDGILTFIFANQRELSIMLNIFEKSASYYNSAQDAFKEVKYVAAGGNAADIRQDDVTEKLDIHGVGLTLGLSRNGKSVTVREIAPGSPAALSNSAIRVHDHLLKVNDVDVKHSCATLEDVGKLIRGRRGTKVKLVLRRSRDVERIEGNRETQDQTVDFSMPMQAKAKYEVVLRRGPPADARGSTADEVDGSAGEILRGEEMASAAAVEDAVSLTDDDTREPEQTEQQETDLLQPQLDNFGAEAPSIEAEGFRHGRGIHSHCLTGSADGQSSIGTADGQSRKPLRPYSNLLQAAGERQAQARVTHAEVLKPLALWSLANRAKEFEEFERREAPDDEAETFQTDIGITLSAADGRYIVCSVDSGAPQSVRNSVCAGDELACIDGEELTLARPGQVWALLKISGARVFCVCCLYLMYSLMYSLCCVLFGDWGVGTHSNVHLTFKRRNTTIRIA